MKKIIKVFLILGLFLTGCTSQKHEWKETYHLTYFYLEDCSNCQYFKKSVLPAIKEEFGKHITIKAWNMDDDQNVEAMKSAYNGYINQFIDFNQDHYGYGPLVILDGYFAVLGAGNKDEYVTRLINAIEGKKIKENNEIETIYYLKDGKVKQ